MPLQKILPICESYERIASQFTKGDQAYYKHDTFILVQKRNGTAAIFKAQG